MLDLAPEFNSAAEERLLRLLGVEGPTGHEGTISQEVAAMLRESGVPDDAIRSDDAHTKIPLPTPCGNLIVTLPGTRPGPRRMFMSHLDTVPLCAGAAPVKQGRKIINSKPTALGGDNRTGCAVLATLAAELLARKLPHPPLTLLFTVREESGLWGARHVDPDDLANPTMAFNFDGRNPSEISIGAVGAVRWEAEVHGIASHAGVAPQKGISAIAAVSLGISDIYKSGWFGKISKNKKVGTSNVGILAGPTGGSAGDATNVVTDYVRVYGEARSHDPKFSKEIAAAYQKAFARAAKQVTNDKGKSAKVKFTPRLDYYPFRMKETSEVVLHAARGVERIGRKPSLKVSDGGLDANWMVKHGIPTVTFGAGQNEIHTVNEWVDLNEFTTACRLALALAVAENEV